MIKKLFGWARYQLSDKDRVDSETALKQAEETLARAHAIREESHRVGARQAILRQENGFGKNLTHVFKGT
jgi:hypothetical protein